MKNKLQEIREQKGITQIELALAVGTTRQTIYNLETKSLVPALDLAYKIALYLRVEVKDIWTPNYYFTVKEVDSDEDI